jgi:hypothetical protein
LQPTREFGFLISSAMLLALIGDLIVLPASIMAVKNWLYLMVLNMILTHEHRIDMFVFEKSKFQSLFTIVDVHRKMTSLFY